VKPRIIFYNPKSNENKKILPMSLLAVAAPLEGEYEVAFVDGNCQSDPLAAIRAQIQSGANLLATTVMPGPQLSRAVPHSRELKREFPDLIMVWGGYFPTQHADTCLAETYVDYVVRGHGEIIFKNLLTALRDDQDVAKIAGLSFRNQKGEVVNNPLAPIPHPEQMPPWPYHRIEMKDHLRNTFLGSRTLPHHSSYGCPFFCNFCGVVNMVKGRWLPQSARRVAEIAQQYVRNWGVNAIDFYDSNFFTQEARVSEFSERILPLHISWWGEGRIDTMLKFSNRTWSLMRDSGLRMVFMGAESSSAETLKQMDKGGTLTPEMTLEMAAKIREYRIIPEFSIVLGNPPNAEKDISDSIEFVRRIKRINPAAEIVLYTYTPVPLDGGLYEEALATGFHFPETLDEWVSDEWLAFARRHSSNLPWLEPRLMRRVRNFERVLNAYYPTTTDARLMGWWRELLKGVSAWRYNTRFYEFPLELRAMQKLVHYQRPETSGF
jgi:B12 binding domain/Radical SAM superfamily